MDRIVDHRPPTCTRCAAPLFAAALGNAGDDGDDGDDFVAHQVTELPPVRATVTEHRLHRVTCLVCGHATRATLPADVPAGAFGPRLQATVAVLSGQYRLSR